MRRYALLFVAAAVGLAVFAPSAPAESCGPNCCARCGCHAACVEKVCQVVCSMKKEKKSYWCVECSEFCTLLPGCRDRCECGQPDPRCGRAKCVQKLVKKEYDVEVPVYKCVVLTLCPACANGQAPTPAATVPKAPLPPAPLPPKPLPPTVKPKK